MEIWSCCGILLVAAITAAGFDMVASCDGALGVVLKCCDGDEVGKLK